MSIEIEDTYVYTKTQAVVVRRQKLYPYGMQIPPEFEPTGEFRPPNLGEYFLNSPGGNFAITALSVDYDKGQPRVILKKLPPRKRYVITETGEERTPKEGEFFLWGPEEGVRVNKATHDYTKASKYRIVTLKVEDVY